MSKLERNLGPFLLWGLGVGYVISGMYFGWNLGLPKGGTLGFAIATFFIMLMYITFTFSYTELACAIPKAGGAFDYANLTLNHHIGYIAGVAQIIEFVFAPPAIAAAIGAYFHIFLPSVPVLVIAIGAYLLFTSLNIYGVKTAASFELFVTILAVAELLIFAGITLPHFQYSNLEKNPLPNGVAGIFASIPFAIWFFLAIEGVANVAEEVINPQKNILIGFGFALLTLVILCILTFISSIGVNGWESIVYPQGSTEMSDSPLPLALSFLVGKDSALYHMLITIGLFGLVASFHGIILASGRATYEFGRVGYAPKKLGTINEKFHTPANALLANTGIGIIALLTGKTSEIITIACFGALTLYIISMFALFSLRKNHPHIKGSFKVPLYPLTPFIALIIAVISLISLFIFNLELGLIYILILGLTYLYFYFYLRGKAHV
ncbi:MAG: ethanolamine permease [Leptospiraceae bacterium]|nr:ethanolamine permease [Leptospiraceae bacterium]